MPPYIAALILYAVVVAILRLVRDLHYRAFRTRRDGLQGEGQPKTRVHTRAGLPGAGGTIHHSQSRTSQAGEHPSPLGPVCPRESPPLEGVQSACADGRALPESTWSGTVQPGSWEASPCHHGHEPGGPAHETGRDDGRRTGECHPDHSGQGEGLPGEV